MNQQIDKRVTNCQIHCMNASTHCTIFVRGISCPLAQLQPRSHMIKLTHRKGPSCLCGSYTVQELSKRRALPTQYCDRELKLMTNRHRHVDFIMADAMNETNAVLHCCE